MNCNGYLTTRSTPTVQRHAPLDSSCACAAPASYRERWTAREEAWQDVCATHMRGSDSQKGLPRLVVHEKLERAIRWILRGVTTAGILITLVVLPIDAAFGIAALLASVDALLEKTIFYNTSLYVRSHPDFEYDGSKWVAVMLFMTFGERSPSSDKIVGLVFNAREYAKRFFDLLRSWISGSSEDTSNNIRLTFMTDRAIRYYVYLCSER